MIKDGDLVAVFHSVHRVLKAEKKLKEAELPFCLVPAPRALGADCGLVLSFRPELRDEIEDSLAGSGLKIAEIWLMQSGNYQRVA